MVLPGSYAEVRPGIVHLMAERGYEVEKEDGENISFRLKSPWKRLTKLFFEDRISFERDRAGFYVEGRTKDVVLIASALETLMQ